LQGQRDVETLVKVEGGIEDRSALGGGLTWKRNRLSCSAIGR
jgi:hypothetical protein